MGKFQQKLNGLAEQDDTDGRADAQRKDKGQIFFIFFRLSASIRRSYIFRITAMVPPLTPGMMLATPTIAPNITNLTISIPSLSQTSF